MRPSCGSANRVTSTLPLFPVADVSGKTTRSQPASAVSAIRLHVHLQVVLDIGVPDVDLGGGDL